jgi:hypothetical protein
MMRLMMLTLLAISAAATTTTAVFLPAPADAVPVGDQCSCYLYADPDCTEAKAEFVCMGDCVNRGFVFPQCSTVLGCCEYLQTVNSGVHCYDEGTYIRFECDDVKRLRT